MAKAQVYIAIQMYDQVQVLERRLDAKRKALEEVLQTMHPDDVAEYAERTSEEDSSAATRS